jgi:hypothetical protein
MTKLLTVEEVGVLLRISRRAAYRVVREMMHATVAGRLRVPQDAVEQYLQQRMVKPWESSTGAARSGGRTSRTRRGGATGSASGPTTGPLPANDSDDSSSIRPIKVRTRKPPSDPR